MINNSIWVYLFRCCCCWNVSHRPAQKEKSSDWLHSSLARTPNSYACNIEAAHMKVALVKVSTSHDACLRWSLSPLVSFLVCWLFQWAEAECARHALSTGYSTMIECLPLLSPHRIWLLVHRRSSLCGLFVFLSPLESAWPCLKFVHCLSFA